MSTQEIVEYAGQKFIKTVVEGATIHFMILREDGIHDVKCSCEVSQRIRNESGKYTCLNCNKETL